MGRLMSSSSAPVPRPKIVILDGHEANPGDLDWSPLAELGDLVVHPRTSPGEVIGRLKGAQIALTNKTRLPKEVFEACPDLRFISVLATGYDVIDMEAARRHGVLVSNVSGYSTASVVQAGLALLLELVNQAGAHSQAIHAGQWTREAGAPWSMPLGALHELAGKTLLVVGWGAIGSRMGAVCEALGMKVMAAQLPGRTPSSDGVKRVLLTDGLAAADVVSLHCPLKPETRGLFGSDTLATMKPGAILLNLARGPVVDEAAVAEALRTGRMGGYGTDVTCLEPPSADCPVIGAPRCVMTPHVAWATFEARERLIQATVRNVMSFLAGSPVNLVP